MSKYINKQTIILIISCILFLIPTGIALNAFSLDKYSKLRSEAGVAYSVAWLDVEDEYNKIKNGIIAIPTPKPTPIPVQTTCDKCNGTKKVKTGDGLGTTVCPCGAACKCVKTGASPNVSTTRQIVLVTQPSVCEPCKQLDKSTLPALKAVGWTFGEKANIRVMDVDEASAAGYTVDVIPCWIVLDGNGGTKKRYEGYINAGGMGRVWNAEDILPQDSVYTEYKIKK